MKIIGKFTIWQRFEIPDSSEAQLKEFLAKNPHVSFEEIYDWAHNQDFDPECETLEDTAESLEPKENDGRATVEAILGNHTFWDNA
jgi:hypothetical protein